MIRKTIAFCFLLAIVALVIWYVRRETPQKQILRWREEVVQYLTEDSRDLQKAEESNQRILKLIPNSVYDLIRQAEICELRGTPEGYEEALTIYNAILERPDPAVAAVGLTKARLCRVLGRLGEARAALLSVVDAHPYHALMSLGDVAMAALSPGEASRHFSTAIEVAPGGAEAARAREELAGAYLLFTALSPVPSLEAGGKDKAGASQNVFRERARDLLLEVQGFLMKDFPAAEEAGTRLLWLSSVLEKIAFLKSGQSSSEDETPPYLAAWILLDSRVKDWKSVLRQQDAPDVAIAFGKLRLRAASEEAPKLTQDQKGQFRSEAESSFAEALGSDPQKGRELLARLGGRSGQELKTAPETQGTEAERTRSREFLEARSYLRRLIAVGRIYLDSPEFRKIFDDPSSLGLATRIAHGRQSEDTDISAAFAALCGLARLKADEVPEAKRLFEEYLTAAPQEMKARATIFLAQSVRRLRPGDPLVFEYLDRFAAQGGRPLEALPQRVRILLDARTDGSLKDEAARRLDATVEAAWAGATDAGNAIECARMLYAVRGPDEGLAFLKEAVGRNPTDVRLRRLHAELLAERAGGSSEMSKKGVLLREALGQYVTLFLRAPSENQGIGRPIKDILGLLKEEGNDPGIEAVVNGCYPQASEGDARLFSEALQRCFLGEFGGSLDQAQLVQEPGNFEPVLSFLKGTCNVGLANVLLEEAARKAGPGDPERAPMGGGGLGQAASLRRQAEEHLGKALEEFRKGGEFPASRLELLNLELRMLKPGEDVEDALLERIDVLSRSEKIEHAGHFLKGSALMKRFHARYRKPDVKNSELVRILGQAQSAFRSAIRRSPSYTPAYVQLADSFVIQPREGGEMGSERGLIAPDLDKAIGLLKAAPNPSEEVLGRLATYLERAASLEAQAGNSEKARARLDEAKRYLERLALARPSGDLFFRVIMMQLETRDPGAGLLLAQGDQEPEVNSAMEKGRFDLLMRLRKAFRSIPEAEGIRLSLCAVKEASAQQGVRDPAAKEAARQKLVGLYEGALAAYESKSLQPPVLLLNNLAWYLAESPEPADRARALELSNRAKDLVTDWKKMVNLADTYAWCLYRNDSLIEARKVWEEILEAVDVPVVRYHLAMVLLDLRDFDHSMSQVQKALDSRQPFSEAAEARLLQVRIREARRKVFGEDKEAR